MSEGRDAMPGASYQKPADQKVTRHQPKLTWTTLPARGREGPTPELPDWRAWSPETLAWWDALWHTPQATQWAQDGSTLWRLAVLQEELIRGDEKPHMLGAEMRQIEDRHGLNPKAMAQLCWVVEAEVEDEAPAVGKPAAAADRRARLKIV